MVMRRTILAACVALPAAARAAPLVLYDTTPASPTELKPGGTTLSPPPCGLTAPCTDMNTSAQPGLTAPLGGNFEYGISGEASAGVSHHGQGGSLGVLGWIKSGDTTLSLGVSVGTVHFNGPRIVTVQPHS